MESKESREKKIVRVTLLGSIGNFLLLVFKFVAGLAGHSAAMIADAVHSLSDFITDIIVFVFIHISSKPKDEDHRYGHGKYETLATAVIGTVLMGVGIGLACNGAVAIYGYCVLGQELESPGMIALIAALVSIAVKELLYRITVRAGREADSSALVANAWHHRSDALSSVATALGIGGAILLGEKWRVLDPVAAVVVSVLIIRMAWKLIVPAVDELLEKSLPVETEREIIDIVSELPQVRNPHNLYTRRIGNRIAVEVHLRVDGNMTVDAAHELTRVIEARLRKRFGADTHILLHIEPVKKTE